MLTDEFAQDKVSYFGLDPRTKIVLLLTVGVVCLGGSAFGIPGAFRFLLALLPAVLLVLEKKPRPGIVYGILVSAALLMESFAASLTIGWMNLAVMAFTHLTARFAPTFMMGYYLITTTKISEFIAAMERMHVPRQIIIPFAVMLRFFPTITEENGAIGDAMRMRGIGMAGGNVMALLEYRIVPMIVSVIKIGEELSASALTRALGAPCKRTVVYTIGFAARDRAFLVGDALILALWAVLS